VAEPADARRGEIIDSREEDGRREDKLALDLQSCTTADECEVDDETEDQLELCDWDQLELCDWDQLELCDRDQLELCDWDQLELCDWDQLELWNGERQSLSTVDEDEFSDEDELSLTSSDMMLEHSRADTMLLSIRDMESVQASSSSLRCTQWFGGADLLDILHIAPVAHAFWQHAEPFQGLNAQKSQAQHRLSVVSHGFAQAVREACATFSESELVSEVIMRWQAYERQLAIEMSQFNRKQAAARPIINSLLMVSSEDVLEDASNVDG